MNKDIAVQVKNLSKSFKLPHEKHSSIKSMVINGFRGQRIYEKQQVLKDISFEVKKGEFFGIVGRNGSGKSTLLKLLAGIYSPDRGAIHVNGKLTPFIELGVGFNPELTGRENVYLNGSLLGFSRKEMEAMYKDIVEFAELDRFMDQKLKNYSSGMQVRLAFSIAIQAQGDILILDEVLAVGDAEFQQKCNDYFKEIKDSGKTVILVTHSMEAVKNFCTRAILIEDGTIKTSGSPNSVANQYTLDNLNAGNKAKKRNKSELSDFVKNLDVKAVSSLSPSNDDDFVFDITYELNDDIEVALGMSMMYRGNSIVEQNTLDQDIPSEKNKKHHVRYSFPLDILVSQPLSIDVVIWEKKSQKLIGYKTNCLTFTVKADHDIKGGVLRTRGKWSVQS